MGFKSKFKTFKKSPKQKLSYKYNKMKIFIYLLYSNPRPKHKNILENTMNEKIKENLALWLQVVPKHKVLHINRIVF